MEFLQTPDLTATPAARWPAASPPSAARSGFTPAVRPASPAALHRAPVASPAALPALTPATLDLLPASTPFASRLDRAGIKSSFQSLFSPRADSVAATPALLSRKSASGLTPFLNATTTPGLVPPSPSLLPSFTTPAHHGAVPSPSPADAPHRSTPYLAAAAREAVRREFMNMPSYVAPSSSASASASASAAAAAAAVAAAAEPPRPDANPHHSHSLTASPKYSMQVVATTGAQVHSTPSTKNTTEPSQTDSTHPGVAHSSSSPPARRASSPDKHHSSCTNANNNNNNIKSSEQSSSEHHPSSTNNNHNSNSNNGVNTSQQLPQHAHMHPFFFPHAQPPGMMMLGQHAPVMMAPPPGMFPPPGMMMFPGAQPMMPQPPMLMHAPQPMMPPRVAAAKHESPTERKARVENEKQELIREFKKKTREAALVRFRQKRRERRFGKLIRYDCRKKLADARPRVKGRFVRLKTGGGDDESESAPQVVPNLHSR